MDAKRRSFTSSSAATIVVALTVFGFPIMCADEFAVKLKQGTLMPDPASVDSSKSSYIAFRGIPYAKAPIGKLRFKAPQPAEGWSGIFNADKEGAACLQFHEKSKTIIGDEDCLYLNVYSPRAKFEKWAEKDPVLVLIHGGAFQHGSGSSEIYDPKILTDQNVVVVTLNYRLGVLGFLSTNDDTAPGNYGLLDQLEALRWIQRNIARFGGDVNQVTLLGHGAGAASALFHQLSPLSKGTFHQVIALSGSPASDNYIQKSPKKRATELGTLLDCYVVTSFTLLDCLRKNSASDLIMKANEMHKFLNYPAIFVPAVERVFGDNGDFLPDTPINLLKEGLVNRAPVMLGVSRTKGEIFRRELSQIYNHADSGDYFEKSLPEILGFVTSLKHNLDAVALAIKKEYFGNVEADKIAEFENATDEMYADMLVRRFTDVTAKHLSKTGWPTYMYAIERNENRRETLLNLDNEEILPDELRYIFERNEGSPRKENSEEEAIVRRIVTNMWTNFIKTSMPTPNKSPDLPLTWIPMNPGKIRYLSISSKPKLVDGYLDERMNFWNTEIPKIEVRGKPKEEL